MIYLHKPSDEADKFCESVLLSSALADYMTGEISQDKEKASSSSVSYADAAKSVTNRKQEGPKSKPKGMWLFWAGHYLDPEPKLCMFQHDILINSPNYSIAQTFS